VKSPFAIIFALFLSANLSLARADDASNPPSFAESGSFANETSLSRAQNVVLNAMGFLDIPYRWGGSTPESGFDCAGLVQYVFKQAVGASLPRTTYAMVKISQSISHSDLQPGDLVFFNTMRRPNSHVGIYIGENRFIHAPRRGKYVEIVNMTGRYWRRRFNGARRLDL
jgi:cell wall-associated NlpC family hydrolase